jgi:hypothetical protein
MHNRGNKITRTVRLDVPEGKNADQYPIEANIDFRDLTDNSMDIIIDWEVVKKKPKKQPQLEVVDYIDQYVMDEDVKINIAVTYLEMEKELEGLKPYKKFSIVLSALGLALKSKIQAYKELSEFTEKTKLELKDLKDTTPKAWYLTALNQYKNKN